MAVIRRASHSRDAITAPLTTRFASAGSATGGQNGRGTAAAAPHLLTHTARRGGVAESCHRSVPCRAAGKQLVIDRHGHRLPGWHQQGHD